MGIAILKKINQKLPDQVKIMFAPIIRNRLIRNKIYLEQRSELKKYEKLNIEERHQLVLARLKMTLLHAYEHTEYYHSLFDRIGFNINLVQSVDDLKTIPVITKKDIIKYFDSLQANNIDDFYFATTGGSTGIPLKVSLSKESIYKERAFVYHFWSKYGYDDRKSRVASFRGTDFTKRFWKANPLYNEIQMNPCAINSNSINQYVEKMNKFGVDFLHGFPSAIYSFCRFATEKGISLNNKYKAVFLISENVYPFQKEYIEKTLGCPVAPFFGHTERNVFAEYFGGKYFFNNLYGVTEFGDNGEIICTGFLNEKMPLIRYELDDTAIEKESGYDIIGHRDGFVYGKNGEIISAAQLEVHSKILDKVSSYQFVQEKKGFLCVKVCPFNKLESNDIRDITVLFQDKVGEACSVMVEETNQVEFTARGKFKLIVQKYKGE